MPLSWELFYCYDYDHWSWQWEPYEACSSLTYRDDEVLRELEVVPEREPGPLEHGLDGVSAQGLDHPERVAQAEHPRVVERLPEAEGHLHGRHGGALVRDQHAALLLADGHLSEGEKTIREESRDIPL